MTGNPRCHLQNKTYPSLSICFSENLNGKKVAICLLTKWFLPCLTIKYQIQNGGGVGCAPAGAGFSLKLYGDVIILPSQSIPSQSWVQGVRSLLSLLAADEDFSMDLLPFDRFVCMCKCTMNCTVAALQPPLPFTHYKKLNEIFQPQFFQLQCSPFIEKKKKKTSTKVHRSLLWEPQPPLAERAAGGVRCSGWAAASQGHRDSSAARIHQHHLPGICPLPAEGTEKGKSSKKGDAQGSCVLGYNREQEVCQLFS